MNKTPMWIFFDDVVFEYANHYGKDYEKIMINDLKKYLTDFSKNSDIIILTRIERNNAIKWFRNNKLDIFVSLIKNPNFKN